MQGDESDKSRPAFPASLELKVLQVSMTTMISSYRFFW